MKRLLFIGVLLVVGYELVNHVGRSISTGEILGLAVIAAVIVASRRRGVGTLAGLLLFGAAVAIVYYSGALASALIFVLIVGFGLKTMFRKPQAQAKPDQDAKQKA